MEALLFNFLSIIAQWLPFFIYILFLILVSSLFLMLLIGILEVLDGEFHEINFEMDWADWINWDFI